MAKRSKVSGQHTSLRIAPDVLAEVERIAEAADWSIARTIGFLTDAGRLALKNADAAVAAARDNYRGAVTIATVTRENAKRLADVRKSLKGLGKPGEPLRGSPRRSAAAKLIKAGRAKRKPRAALPAVPPAKPDSAA